MDESRAAIRRVQQARQRLVAVAEGREEAGQQDLAEATETARGVFTASLEDDLNTSEALAAVFGLVSEVNKGSPSRDAAVAALAAFAGFEDVLGCFGPEPEPVSDEVPAEVVALLEQREAARAARDFAEADRLRGEVERRGFRIVDTPRGPRVEPR